MSIRPKRREIWYVDLEPTRGAEIRKTRPCIVVSKENIGKLPLRVIVPLTAWQDHFANNSWMVKIEATSTSGLTKDSTADTLQIRGVDLSRFVDPEPSGMISEVEYERILSAVCLTLGIQRELPSVEQAKPEES